MAIDKTDYDLAHRERIAKVGNTVIYSAETGEFRFQFRTIAILYRSDGSFTVESATEIASRFARFDEAREYVRENCHRFLAGLVEMEEITGAPVVIGESE